MPLRITDPTKQVAVLNKWADDIETRIRAANGKIFRVANTTVAAAQVGGTEQKVLVNRQSGTSYTLVDSDKSKIVSFSNNAGGTITLPNGSGSASTQTFVQAKANDASATSVAATFTNNVASGNTIVVIAMGSNLDATTLVPITGVTDNKGNVYTKLSGDITFFGTGNGQLQDMSIWAATGVTGGATTTVTASIAGATNRFLIMTILEYTPAQAFTFDGTPTQANGTGSLTTPGLTTSGVDLLLAIVMYQTVTVDATTTFGAGYTQRNHFFENVLIGYEMVVADQQTTASGTFTANATLGVQGNLALVAIKNGSTPTVKLPVGWFAYLENTGTGTFSVISPGQIDGSAAAFTLGPNQGVLVTFDGTNWFTSRGTGGLVLPVPVGSGGTGVVTLAAHGVLLGQGTQPIVVTGTGTTGQPLVSNGATLDPTYQILSISGGGTGANLSTTGGASQVLKQISVGAVVTVGQLAFSDISGVATKAQLPGVVAYTDAANNFTQANTFTPASTAVVPLSIAGNFAGRSQFNTFANLYVRHDLLPGGLAAPFTNYSLGIGGTSTFPILAIGSAAGSTANLFDAYAPGSTTVKNFSIASPGTIVNYNGIATVSGGVPAEYATTNLTAQGANVIATTVYAIPASGAGLYRVTVYIVVSRVATTSSTLPDSRIIYTDRDSGAVITVPITPGDTGNALTTFQQATFIVNGKALTNIQYDIGQVTAFASVGVTSMQFAYHNVVEFLG